MLEQSKRESLVPRLLKAVIPPALLMKFRATYLVREVVRRKARRDHAMGPLVALVKPGDSVADLGANIGMYALEFSELVGPAGRVYSVEPIESNFQILTDVMRKTRLSNVDLYHAAIGSEAGHQVMVVPNRKGFTGFYSAHFVRDEEEGNTETVEVFTLDDLWTQKKMNDLDFIKADVAGAELEVIAGARTLIRELRPGLLVGVSLGTGDKTFIALRELGYKGFLFRDRLVETDKYRFANTHHYFFLHPESKCWHRALSGGVLDVPSASLAG